MQRNCSLAKGHVLASGALVSLGLPMRSERGSSARARNFRTTKAAVIRPLIIAAAVCLVCDHARGQQRSGNAQPPRDRKILIVYLSRTNNTKAIAEITHQEIGGGLVALELERPYPDDYNAIVQQVVREDLPLRTVRRRVPRLSHLGDAAPAAGPEFSAPIQPPRQNRYPIQHERGIRRRYEFSDREGTLPAMHGLGRIRHTRRSGTGWTISHDRRSKGRGSANERSELVKEGK
jgi:hypothetical protein